jgi:hypothetical protein
MESDAIQEYANATVAAVMPALRATAATWAAVDIVAPEPQELAQRLVDQWVAVAAPKQGRP